MSLRPSPFGAAQNDRMGQTVASEDFCSVSTVPSLMHTMTALDAPLSVDDQ